MTELPRWAVRLNAIRQLADYSDLLLTPSLSTIIERALEEIFPDNIYNHPDFPGLFYISSNLSMNLL